MAIDDGSIPSGEAWGEPHISPQLEYPLVRYTLHGGPKELEFEISCLAREVRIIEGGGPPMGAGDALIERLMGTPEGKIEVPELLRKGKTYFRGLALHHKETGKHELGQKYEQVASKLAELEGWVRPAPDPSRARRRGAHDTIYAPFDKALREIAKTNPTSHHEVFKLLTERRIPQTILGRASTDWMDWFRQRPRNARSWLSKRWAKNELPPFPRGRKQKLP